MAHISEYLSDPATIIGINNYIAHETKAPQTPKENDSPSTPPADEKEKFVWRLHQPTEPRRFQLFPSKQTLHISAGRRASDSETTASLPSGLRAKKELNSSRRRKQSVTDLGPMTTVQELSMDSPTIPGRPPMHERSTSAPGSQTPRCRTPLAQSTSSPSLDTRDTIEPRTTALGASDRRSDSPGKPVSPRSIAPKALTPLLIPQNVSQIPTMINPNMSTRASSPTPQPHSKVGRMLGPGMIPGSPYSRFAASPTIYKPSLPPLQFSQGIELLPTPRIPVASNLTLPTLATNSDTSIYEHSEPITPQSPPNPRSRGQSESATTKERPGKEILSQHKRGESDASVMNRGRPKKRTNSTVAPQKKPASKEQRAFESLPKGVRANEAHLCMDREELESLRLQAQGQTATFQVLRAKDVNELARELRQLDERCSYLRKTHKGLRLGRRNLQERICAYLRSPRTATFSYDNLLKQEEAVSELDQSIDEWSRKIDIAENRRLRVRQKLLEHIAAATMLSAFAPSQRDSMPSQGQKLVDTPITPGEVAPSETMTPPRSPDDINSSDTCLRPLVEGAGSPENLDVGRGRAESIRIYVESDVYELLADVEAEMDRMTAPKEKESTLEQLTSASYTPYSVGMKV